MSRSQHTVVDNKVVRGQTGHNVLFVSFDPIFYNRFSQLTSQRFGQFSGKSCAAIIDRASPTWLCNLAVLGVPRAIMTGTSCALIASLSACGIWVSCSVSKGFSRGGHTQYVPLHQPRAS